ncbi:MAG: MATE family efflux transporter [Spirochaetales bacterium]|nr:MATE family efflux transporter [Spirochaetales bacterium]
MESRRQLFQNLLRLAVPIALQNLVGSALNLVDTVMIGSLGSTSIASVGLANQIFFLLNLFLFGVGSGAAIFTAQFWGKKDIASIRRSLGLSLTVMLLGAGLFFALCQTLPRFVIGIFSPDPRVIALGGRFLQIMSWGFLFQAVSAGFVSVLRSVERVRMPLVAGVVSLALNTFLNWCLIFGNLGFPKWGVAGSAFATILARLVEMSIILASVYLGKSAVRGRSVCAASLRELFSFTWGDVRRFVGLTWPVVGNELGWALGYTVPSLIFAHLGTDDLAAYNIADTAIKLVIVIFFGTTSANAVLVGKKIGEGDHEGARRTARYFAIFAPLLGLSTGLILAASSFLVPQLFHVNGVVKGLAAAGMLIFALDMPLRMFNWHVIVGILRAGGDTKFGLLLDVGMTWMVSVPLASVAGLVFAAPFWLVYVATLVEDVPKFFMGVARLHSGKWLNDVTQKSPEVLAKV